MIRKQKLVTVRVATTDTSEVITLVDGKPVEDLLADWRIVGMQSLGPHTGGYTALLLLEELPPESSGGRLGFATEE
ncbi:MAG TPA: hypothetical protein VH988_25250 [Thermoanaerobaculia bacterium]|jgi:hypothetical protein|nr:hypothetical protein [Thermoanaerobaculia bacterium]